MKIQSFNFVQNIFFFSTKLFFKLFYRDVWSSEFVESCYYDIVQNLHKQIWVGRYWSKLGSPPQLQNRSRAYVILDSKLNFACHVDAAVLKARRMLGLLIRSMQLPVCSRRAKLDYKAMLSAFNAHVRSVMEYGSVVWAGAAVTHLKRLERIQHSFLIWLACSSNQHSFNLRYDHLLRHFKVASVKSRFLQHDLMFMYNVFHGRLDSSQLLSNFDLSAPARRTRSPSLWSVPFARVATVKNGTFCRIATRCNEFLNSSTCTDFFCSSSTEYKAAVRTFAARTGAY